jgi:hypothetical protein
VRTATALLAACDAESRWGAAAGAAIDEAAAAANRERVMSFAAAAASAAAMLLQRLQVTPCREQDTCAAIGQLGISGSTVHRGSRVKQTRYAECATCVW